MKNFQRILSNVLKFVITPVLTVVIFITYMNGKTVPVRQEHQAPSKGGVKESNFDLRIIVITYNRASSLLRLLHSINNAEYFSDSIKLEVWVDISKEGKSDNLTIDSAYKFKFKHGLYDVYVRQEHAGIYGQWLSSWKPSKRSTEIGVILEDDLTVSPYFYKYLKAVHRKYDSYPDINGYALQGYTIKHHVRDMSILEGPTGSLVFLYPVLGTWGFSPVTEKWLNFLDWFDSIDSLSRVDPYIPDNICSVWFKSFRKQGTADSMWEIWHIYYAWLHSHYTLYSNFPGQIGLSNSYRESGLHYDSGAGASNQLLTEWKSEYDNLPDVPFYLDIAGKRVNRPLNDNLNHMHLQKTQNVQQNQN